MAKDRSKINQTVLENYTNVLHEMPMTKHSNYLAMTSATANNNTNNGGDISPTTANRKGNNMSPFDSLKYYWFTFELIGKLDFTFKIIWISLILRECPEIELIS